MGGGDARRTGFWPWSFAAGEDAGWRGVAGLRGPGGVDGRGCRASDLASGLPDGRGDWLLGVLAAAAEERGGFTATSGIPFPFPPDEGLVGLLAAADFAAADEGRGGFATASVFSFPAAAGRLAAAGFATADEGCGGFATTSVFAFVTVLALRRTGGCTGALAPLFAAVVAGRLDGFAADWDADGCVGASASRVALLERLGATAVERAGRPGLRWEAGGFRGAPAGDGAAGGTKAALDASGAGGCRVCLAEASFMLGAFSAAVEA